jgi:hypothetical protein
MDTVNDELQRRINEHVLNGDAPSIIWAIEGQIRINTQLEAKLAELERREALLTAYYHAAEDWMEWEQLCDEVYCPDEQAWFAVGEKHYQAKHALDWLS